MRSDTHKDIARFEVAVNKVVGMDVLQATELGIVDISPSVVVSEVEFTHQLPSQKQYSPDCKLEICYVLGASIFIFHLLTNTFPSRDFPFIPSIT